MRRQAGFGLIEVMLAFIIVAVTSGALLQLNKVYLEYSRDGAYREVAIRLAESRLDELRTFSSEAEYAAVTSGTELITAHNGISYGVSWDINELDHRKDVVITVSWNDPGGTKSLVMESTIAPNLSVASGPFGTADDSPGISMSGPEVSYSPGAIPDIVSITTDPGSGTKQETTKPAPDVKKNSDDVVVSFDSIIYNSASNRLIQSDTRTLYCNCTYQSGDKLSRKPSVPYHLADGVYWLAGGLAEKPWGDSDNPDCKTCCNDHVDAGSAFEDVYNQFNLGHGHYKNGAPVSAGESYFESCRMLRIDGFYRVMPDWNLVALNVFPPYYLSKEDNVNVYQRYVKDVVKAYIEEQKNKADYSYVDYKAVSYNYWLNLCGKGCSEAKLDFDKLSEVYMASYQLLARAVYVDLLAEDMLDKIDLSHDNWMAKVSFNEINVTFLADWWTESEDVSVTNQKVVTDLEGDGTYSRGWMTAKKATEGDEPKVKVKVAMTRYNTALTGQRYTSGEAENEPISEFDKNHLISELPVLVKSGSQPVVRVTGTIRCWTVKNKNSSVPNEEGGCSQSDVENKTMLTFVPSENVFCDVDKPTKDSTAIYYCDIPEGLSISLTFSNNDFDFDALTVQLDGVQGEEGKCVRQMHKNISEADRNALSCTSVTGEP